MSLIDDVRLQATCLAPLPPAELILDPIQRLQAQSNFVLSLLADLNPAAVTKLREYAISFAIYRGAEFEKLRSLSMRDATVQDIVDLWSQAAEDFHELVRLHAKICDVAERS